MSLEQTESRHRLARAAALIADQVAGVIASANSRREQRRRTSRKQASHATAHALHAPCQQTAAVSVAATLIGASADERTTRLSRPRARDDEEYVRRRELETRLAQMDELVLVNEALRVRQTAHDELASQVRALMVRLNPVDDMLSASRRMQPPLAAAAASSQPFAQHPVPNALQVHRHGGTRAGACLHSTVTLSARALPARQSSHASV